DCIGPEVQAKVERGKAEDIFLLENLRFYKEEEENDYAFAHSLAELAEIYVNDAFAVSHRKHASVNAVTKFLPSVAGLLLQIEILNLKRGLVPERPAVWLMGGAKLKKVELLESALSRADKVLIGGALCFSFLKAKGIPVGNSLIDYETVKIAKRFLNDKRAKKIILPLDFVCTKKMSAKAKIHLREYNEIPNDEIALDIGPKTVQLFELHLNKAKTVVWNGPMGYFEYDKFAKGSKSLAKTIAEITVKNKTFSIAGGGETAAMIKKFKLKNNFTHISTGGGASLMFLSGKKLPAIIALEESSGVFVK
ncbi:MAG: phosphoglycerate kinase, partial [Nanoarchaeota archaeon]|nr:phosphoglycerate kinase [Nanoarchaeota archaeon]